MQASLSLHLSKCHIVGNHVSQLIFQVKPLSELVEPDLGDDALIS